MNTMKFAVTTALTCLLFAPSVVTAQEPKRGGTLNFAVSAEPPNYDCHANTSFAFVHPVRPSYNTLLRFVPDNYPEIEGDLAEILGGLRRRPDLHLQAAGRREIPRRQRFHLA